MKYLYHLSTYWHNYYMLPNIFTLRYAIYPGSAIPILHTWLICKCFDYIMLNMVASPKPSYLWWRWQLLHTQIMSICNIGFGYTHIWSSITPTFHTHALHPYFHVFPAHPYFSLKCRWWVTPGNHRACFGHDCRLRSWNVVFANTPLCMQTHRIVDLHPIHGEWSVQPPLFCICSGIAAGARGQLHCRLYWSLVVSVRIIDMGTPLLLCINTRWL